jgi:nickel-dependent lactate racemase
MLGQDALTYRIVQNNAFDLATQVCLGPTQAGHDIWLNAELAACPVKILTGFIEPHFFAGFSGGGKAVMPGMAGLRTILQNHCYQHIASPRATWGVTHGNPVWEEVREVARAAGATFLLNVALNREKAITAVFAGDLDAAHAAGTAFVRQAAMQPVAQPFDIVVTTKSGYPLDLNLYQTVKGMSAAAQVVKPGGAIIAVSECWDGIPGHGLFGKLLSQAGSPAKVLETVSQPGFLELDQWEAQVQAQVQLKAEVHVFAGGLTDEQIRAALLIPCRSVEDTLRQLLQRYGPQARICILPEGPQTVPYVEEK